ncbi:PrpF domain-containing protein [Psychrobacillus antarcticus]|uniref:PrpF domain-containing protein n=1 Tax=Psychrobacillus antarcticus TaxID=2879115 RepID=UPI0024081652|nr:PrpF domain-containing protein [Psychrobacillus antarcticus]
MSQFSVPAIVYRGGTSRGVFFHQHDLPKEQSEMKHIFYHAIDSYNSSQVNGLGSGTSHTSKIVVIGPPTHSDANVDYSFYQMGISQRIADIKGTCGNLMAAVGAFAVDEGLVDVPYGANSVTVYAFNTNISKIIEITVPVTEGQAKVVGDFHMPGIVTKGAKYIVDILQPGGGKTGKTLPLGPTLAMDIPASFVDIVNPFLYLAFKDFGFEGKQLKQQLENQTDVLAELNDRRCEAAVIAGMEVSINEAKKYPAVPKVALVASPHDYVTTSGIEIKKEQYDIFATMLSMGNVHKTFAGSGLYNIAAAALLSGTIPNKFCSLPSSAEKVRVAHADGIVEVRVKLNEAYTDVTAVGLERTARRIMKGNIFITKSTYMEVL